MKSKSILMVVVALTIGLVAVSVIPSQYYCGHPVSFWTKVVGPTHCCRSGASLANIRMIALALEMYHKDYGAYPESASNLVTADFISRELPSDITYKHDSGSYVLTSPHDGRGGVSYLVKPDGAIHFSRDRTATEDDPILTRR